MSQSDTNTIILDDTNFILCGDQVTEAKLKDTIWQVVDEKPSYPNGNYGYLELMRKYANIITSGRSGEKRCLNKIYYRIIIDEDGYPIFDKILSDHGCKIKQDQLINLVSNMECWIPAKRNCEIVSSYYNLVFRTPYKYH